jgi:hypothetical protein
VLTILIALYRLVLTALLAVLVSPTHPVADSVSPLVKLGQIVLLDCPVRLTSESVAPAQSLTPMVTQTVELSMIPVGTKAPSQTPTVMPTRMLMQTQTRTPMEMQTQMMMARLRSSIHATTQAQKPPESTEHARFGTAKAHQFRSLPQPG